MSDAHHERVVGLAYEWCADRVPELTTYQWNPETKAHDWPAASPVPRHVVTVEELYQFLARMLETGPDHWRHLPVHIIDMDDTDPDVRTWDGLVTDVELDVYEQEQGLVLTLVSWPNQPPGVLPRGIPHGNDVVDPW